MPADTEKRPATRTDAAPESVAQALATPGREPCRITLEATPPAAARADVLVVGMFADGTPSPAGEALDAASKGAFSSLARRGDIETKAGSTLLLYDVPGASARRVLLVNLGPREKYSDKAFGEALRGTSKALATLSGGEGDGEAAVTLTDVEVPGRSLVWRLRQGSRLLADGAYRFDAPRAGSTQEPQRGVRSISLLTSEVNEELDFAVRCGTAVAEGMALAKDLGNLPGNVCNPAYLADRARELGQEFNFEVDVLEREDMARLGMHSALSVGRASAHPCKFIVMHYRGGQPTDKPVVLVGKGITFDTGGVSLKPGDDLDMMKYDMCGAASVFGAMKTVARLALPLNVVGIVGAFENMPGGNASRPGDVVRSMSGLTIEILNTDAEGRLVLCDALTYAERFDPQCVIDIATLTGACVIALGTQTSGLFSPHDDLADELLECGTDALDRAWRMPLFEEYHEQLKSNFADMSNLGGRPAGAVTAACFLSRFTDAYPWAHLDIAGTASVSGEAKGATGRPVPLLCEFLVKRSAG